MLADSEKLLQEARGEVVVTAWAGAVEREGDGQILEVFWRKMPRSVVGWALGLRSSLPRWL